MALLLCGKNLKQLLPNNGSMLFKVSYGDYIGEYVLYHLRRNQLEKFQELKKASGTAEKVIKNIGFWYS